MPKLAMVAWPHKGTSSAGVKNSILKSALSELLIKAVSAYPSSLAIFFLSFVLRFVLYKTIPALFQCLINK